MLLIQPLVKLLASFKKFVDENEKKFLWKRSFFETNKVNMGYILRISSAQRYFIL